MKSQYHQQFGDGHIIAKMNSLTDKKAHYEVLRSIHGRCQS